MRLIHSLRNMRCIIPWKKQGLVHIFLSKRPFTYVNCNTYNVHKFMIVEHALLNSCVNHALPVRFKRMFNACCSFPYVLCICHSFTIEAVKHCDPYHCGQQGICEDVNGGVICHCTKNFNGTLCGAYLCLPNIA